MVTQRQIRFGELIRSLLSDCLLKEDFFDENINSSSITIYIFQKFLSKSKINSKFTPKLSFYLDDTFDEAEKIENLLLNKIVLRDIK